MIDTEVVFKIGSPEKFMIPPAGTVIVMQTVKPLGRFLKSNHLSDKITKFLTDKSAWADSENGKKSEWNAIVGKS